MIKPYWIYNHERRIIKEQILIGAVVQIRMGSKRLPKKSMMKIGNKPLIQHVLENLKKIKKINKIIVATTCKLEDDIIEDWCIENNYKIFRGSELNVLERYYNAAQENNLQYILRVTGDNPFKDSNLIKKAIDIIINSDFDIVTNVFPPTYPEGLIVELLKFSCLKEASVKASSDFEKEHVTQYIYKNYKKFNIFNLKNKSQQSHIRLTIDTIEDLRFIKKIDNLLSKNNKNYNYQDVIKLITLQPELLKMNKMVKKSAMFT